MTYTEIRKDMAALWPCDVPHEHGAAMISKVVLDDTFLMMSNLRYVRDGNDWMCLYPGEIRRLHIMTSQKRGDLWMSDTAMEWRTNRPFLRAARGRVMVAGLGMRAERERWHGRAVVVTTAPDAIEPYAVVTDLASAINYSREFVGDHFHGSDEDAFVRAMWGCGVGGRCHGASDGYAITFIRLGGTGP